MVLAPFRPPNTAHPGSLDIISGFAYANPTLIGAVMTIIFPLVVFPVLSALAIIALGLWLAIRRRATAAWVPLALVVGPVAACLWTFGAHRGLGFPLLSGEPTGVPAWLHLLGILVTFTAVQVALVRLVRCGPAANLALCLSICAVFSLAGPLFVVSL